jgi:hypothetical protein
MDYKNDFRNNKHQIDAMIEILSDSPDGHSVGIMNGWMQRILGETGQRRVLMNYRLRKVIENIQVSPKFSNDKKILLKKQFLNF